MKRIYLDNAATTKPRSEVIEAMLPYQTEKYGNPSSLHSMGREAAEAMEESRATIAKHLGSKPEEIYFVASGTEANNTVLKGVAFQKKKGHIITQTTEHDCVINATKWLGSQGFDITFLDVDDKGVVHEDTLREAMRDDTILVSIMAANNEIGTIQAINRLGAIAHEGKALFHTDAVQAFGKMPLSLENIDFLSASAHKLYGPRGVGFLFKRDGVWITPLLHGGGHERGLRSSTENVAGIVGFAKATELAFAEMGSEAAREIALRDSLIKGVLEIKDSWLNGHPTNRLPNNANFGFRFIEGEGLVLRLDLKGIEASTGSACSSKNLRPSHVLTSMGLKAEDAHGSLRLTLGRESTKADMDYVLEMLPGVVESLRAMSPLTE